MLLDIFAIAIVIFGIFLIVRPKLAAEHLKRFYGRYPIIRYAGDRQLTTRPNFIIILGIIIVFIGIIALIGK